MKAIRKVLAVTVALAMILAMTACSGYKMADKYTNVTLGGLKLDIRSDMKFDDSQKNAAGEKVEGYYCDYFGLTVTSESAPMYKLSGYEDAEAYLDAVIEANNLSSKVESSNGNVYIDYTNTVGSTEYSYTAYGLELGYRYYMLQFFCKSGEQDKYREEYEKILGTVELAEVPAETQEIVISGIKMTVGGDFEKLNDSQYYGSKYFISAISSSASVSVEDFANRMISSNNYTTADGQASVVTTTEDGMATFECSTDDQYVYHYLKTIDSKIVYIFFITTKPADDTTKAEFVEIVKNAALA